MSPRLIVLGWDSATFDVIDPLLDRGKLPVLRELMTDGVHAGLRSTWPPMTDCAWTSAFTGCNPGHHGIFGSWYRAPGAYACRYFASGDRQISALWEMTDGVRFLVWNVPMTFPPTPLEGVMVAGYGAPPGARFCHPPGVQDRLAQRWALEDLLDRAPSGSLERFREELVRGVRAQSEALVWLAHETGADCVVAVWPHIDRAQHFFWRFMGSTHPLGRAIEQVYEAVDAATGRVVTAFPDSDVMVVSDHGAGPLEGDVNLGAWLAERGHAVYRPKRSSQLVDIAWALPPALRRQAKRLAPRLARRAQGASMTQQLGPFDWTKTKAFLGVHGDLWVNLEEREPEGTVRREAAEELLDELKEDLLDLTDPRNGKKPFAGVYPRDDIYRGEAAALAPDLVLDAWSAGYRVAPKRDPAAALVAQPESLPGVNEAWSSDHRPLGILVAAGPRFGSGRCAELSLYDVCPTALALLDQPIPGGLDGRAVREALAPSFLQEHPIRQGAPLAARRASGEYSQEEAAAIAAHLKDLGYLE